MSNATPGAAVGSRTHPAIIVAAVAVTGACVVGAAAFLGWLPRAGSGTSPMGIASPGQQVSGGIASEYPVAPPPEPAIAEPKAAAAPKPVTAAPKPVTAAPKPAAAADKPATSAKATGPGNEPKKAEARPEARKVEARAESRKPEPPKAQVSAAKVQPTTPDYRSEPASSPAPSPAPVAASAPAVEKACPHCGTVIAITAIEQPGEGSGLGAVIGGVVGGVLGHQVGGGRGKDVATVAGAVGGAYAGHQIEKGQRRASSWEVRAKLEDGTTKTLRYASEPSFRVGDKVRLEGETLVRR